MSDITEPIENPTDPNEEEVVEDPVTNDDPTGDDTSGDEPSGDDPSGDDPSGGEPSGDDPVDPDPINPDDPDPEPTPSYPSAPTVSGWYLDTTSVNGSVDLSLVQTRYTTGEIHCATTTEDEQVIITNVYIGPFESEEEGYNMKNALIKHGLKTSVIYIEVQAPEPEPEPEPEEPVDPEQS